MRKSGFSLVEILIATTILLVIVMMVSMVFQQQSAAFQSGQDRVKGQAAIRNIVGMIVRDLSLAVDSKSIENAPVSNEFKGSTIKFLATTGEAGASVDGDSGTGSASVSVLQCITYTREQAGNKKFRVKRTVTDYKLDANWKWTQGKTVTTTLNNEDYLESIAFTTKTSAGGSDTFPDSVTVTAVYAGSSHTGAISGWSEGPSKNPRAHDDIYVGAKFQP